MPPARAATMSAVDLADRIVPDELWAAIAPLLPGNVPRPQGGGRRQRENRTILTAVVYVLTTDTPWRQIPPWCGVSQATAYRRFRAWVDADVWTRLMAVCPDDEWCQIVAERALAVASATCGSRPPGGVTSAGCRAGPAGSA